MTWLEAFHRQASSDFEVFKHFSRQSSPVAICHRLHYIQMASEKLVKSFLTLGSDEVPKKTHSGLLLFLRTLRSNPFVRSRLGFSDKHQKFDAYLKGLQPVAEAIDLLAPALGTKNGVNAEYPWSTSSGPIQYPANYAFRHISLTEIVRFADFIERLLKIYPD
jgi:hypothetical protein